MRFGPIGARHLLVAVAVLGIQCGTSDSGTGPSIDQSDAAAGDGSVGADAADGGGALDAAIDGALASPFGIATRPPNATCVAAARPPSGSDIMTAPAFPNLPAINQPTALRLAPDGRTWFVISRLGQVQTFPNDSNASTLTTVLDISSMIETLYAEGGLIGMALHPKFPQKPYIYLTYSITPTSTDLRTEVVRFSSADGGLTFDPASAQTLFDFAHPVGIHFGGNLDFGPDGFLYFGAGDSSFPDDGPQITDPTGCTPPAVCPAYLGKLLRVDVDSASPYAIPPTNPFAAGGGAKELFAWGFRNPWRWSFDRATGDLWVGDVGEVRMEEIDQVHVGENYGWDVKEGTICEADGGCDNGTKFVDPVFEHPHPDMIVIIGGYVYRGSAIPGFNGTFVYGDEGNGVLRGLSFDPVTGNPTSRILNPAGPLLFPSSFAEDAAGELYALDFTDGHIYAILPAGPAMPDNFPKTLSATGCVDPKDPALPAPGLIPYSVNAPLWSDGATKDRWLAIPDGTTIQVGADGDWNLPVGSVAMKTFSLGGKRVETRLYMRHLDGDWAGYSYEWSDDQKDATLLPGAKTKSVGAATWSYPSRTDCQRCHTTAAGRTLGLETAQLDGDFAYPSGSHPQLATLQHIGLFDSPLATKIPYPPPDGPAPIDQRARAYLQANCSFCHRADNIMTTTMDLRFYTAASDMKLCNVAPQRGDLGVTGANIVTPGHASTSILSLRPHDTGSFRMPPLATHVVDPSGTALLDAWINGLTACP